MGNSENRSINIFFNEAELNAALARSQAEGAKLQKQMEDISDKSSPKFKELQSQLDATNNKITQFAGQINGTINPSLKQMEDQVKHLYNEWRNIPVGTEEARQKLIQFEQASEGVAKVKTQVQGVSGALKEMKDGSAFLTEFKAFFLAGGLLGALEKAAEFIKDAVKEAAKLEGVQAQLKNSLEGVSRADLFEPMKKQAEELGQQFKTVLPSDIMAAQTAMVTFGHLSKDQIDELLPVIINYAAKTRKEIPDATNDILRALEGQGRGMKALGVEIVKGGSIAENYAILMSQLAPRVANAAATMEATTGGSLKKLSVSWTLFKEDVGTSLLTLMGYFQKVAVYADAMAEVIATKSLSNYSTRIKAGLKEINDAYAASKKDITDKGGGNNSDPFDGAQEKAVAGAKFDLEIAEKSGKDIYEAKKHLLEQELLLQNQGVEYYKVKQAELDKLEEDATKKRLADLQKATQFLQEYEALLTKVHELELSASAAQISPDDKAIQDLKNKRQQLLDELAKMEKKGLDEGLITQKKATEETEQGKKAIQQYYDAALIELQDKQFLTHTEKELAASQIAIQKKGDAEKNAVNEQYASELISKVQHDAAIEAIDAKTKHALAINYGSFAAALTEGYANDKAKLESVENAKVALQNAAYAQDVQNQLNALKRKQQAIKDQDQADLINAQQSGDLSQIYDTELKQLTDHLKLDLAAYSDNAAAIINLTQDTESQRQKIIADSIAKINAMEGKSVADKEALIESSEASINLIFAQSAQKQKSVEDNFYKGLSNDIKGFGDATMRLFSDVTSFMKSQDDAALADEQRSNDAKKASFQKQLDAKQISQATFDKKTKALDDQLAKDTAEAKKKAAEADKAAKIIQATINMAVAITAAMGGGPIIGQVLAAITAAICAVEIGLIAATPIPTFAKGGVAQGASHSGGGISMVDSASGRKVGEMENNEPYMILSGNTYNNNRHLVDALLHSSMHGGGAPVNVDWYGKVPRFDFGGIFNSMNAISATGSSNNSNNALNVNLMNTLSQLTNALQQGISAKVVYGDIVDAGTALNKAQSRASYSKS